MSLLEAFLEDGLLNPPVMEQEIWFAVREDGVQGAGTEQNPFNGGNSAWMGIFSGIPINTTIRFQPGTFPIDGLIPKSGQRIVGSGIGVTTLKMTGATTSAPYYAIGVSAPSASTNYFQLSDLTIDCDFAHQTNADSIGAVSLLGSNILIRRVKVINGGVRAAGASGISVGTSAAGGTGAANGVIEDCAVAQSSASEAIFTLFNLEGTWAAKHTNCVIRRCFDDASTMVGTRRLEISAG
jgi:hypothetical protein